MQWSPKVGWEKLLLRGILVHLLTSIDIPSKLPL